MRWIRVCLCVRKEKGRKCVCSIARVTRLLAQSRSSFTSIVAFLRSSGGNLIVKLKELRQVRLFEALRFCLPPLGFGIDSPDPQTLTDTYPPTHTCTHTPLFPHSSSISVVIASAHRLPLPSEDTPPGGGPGSCFLFSWKRLTILFFLSFFLFFFLFCLFIFVCVCKSYFYANALKRNSHKVGPAHRESLLYICGNAHTHCLDTHTHTHTHTHTDLDWGSLWTRPVLSDCDPHTEACLTVSIHVCVCVCVCVWCKHNPKMLDMLRKATTFISLIPIPSDRFINVYLYRSCVFIDAHTHTHTHTLRDVSNGGNTTAGCDVYCSLCCYHGDGVYLHPLSIHLHAHTRTHTHTHTRCMLTGSACRF